ncbi:tRNA lysidine(34) synthetase TilS [Caviibacter abscessus]|uniref:tRNA lysidine(34) synthetase TilS n=1 Tax=Caviibacter abscessus TaxID=1766719 RepID=UPI00082A5430|nr:tRNA lysidine(34) synthetase TilS [Caviibacter abscessus]
MKKILIAFSGGPDSVYLYYHLKKMGHILYICYVNHNLREDVNNDIEFVTKFCNDEKVPFVIKSINISNFSENIAREKRYIELEKARVQFGCDYIATGHNMNDNVETILFRLARGTGIEGLKGIPKKRGNIIRPIIDIQKEYILEYLDKNNIKYLRDYTNEQNIYSRNIIRNKIIPILKEINSNAINNIANLIKLVNEDDEKNRYIITELKRNNININKNKVDEIKSTLLKSGTSIRLNEKYIWYNGYNFKGIKELKNSDFSYFFYNTINLNENFNIYEYNISFANGVTIKNKLEKKEYKIYNVENVSKLIIRNRTNGDKINSKKIKDILISKKIERYDRDKIPVITDENNNILLLADIKSSDFVKEIKNINELEDNKLYVSIERKGHKC